MAKTITLDDNEFLIAFPFNAEILAVVRNLPTRTWDGERRVWRAPNIPPNVTAVSELATRFDFALVGGAADIIHVQANELDQLLAEALDAGEAAPCETPQIGYRVRGGGSMLDGTQAYRVFRRNDGDMGVVECEADRSGLSGSGRSGYVSYELDGDGAYMVRKTSGSIQRQWHGTSCLYVRRGQCYALGEMLMYALLGIDPALVATRRAERRQADGAYLEEDAEKYYD